MYLQNYYSDTNGLVYVCDKCNYAIPLNCNQSPVFKMVSNDVCILKDGEQLTCPRCGNIHDSNTPLLKKQSSNIPRCPICHSSNIHKIAVTNKVGSAVAFGVFAIGHVGKTYKCNSCGAKF